MKIEKNDILEIRKKFELIQTESDFVLLLDQANSILYKNEYILPISLSRLKYYSNPEYCKNRYTSFSIKKKSGGERIINAPRKGLKTVLKTINFVLQCMYEPNKAATGFVINKSIVDNAKLHCGNRYVYNIDLKDFFHSFDRNRVKMGLLNYPINLSGNREKIAFLIASLCTHPIELDGELKNVLPQGSPASPTLTNILCQNLDRRLIGLAKRFGAKYTRYADDITFSSNHNIYNNNDFLNELNRIIEEDQSLVINPAKTRLQKQGFKQEVTGLIVNEKVNVTQRYVKQIRMWLYYWEKYGYEKAQLIFIMDYNFDKGHVKKGAPKIENVLDGKLEFLRMVKGTEDSTYQTLKKRLDKLAFKTSNLANLLEVWEKEGIEKAMVSFHKN